MHIVFLDEFGHIGPFVAKSHRNHNTSPVFGLAGYFMPDYRVREFASWYYNFKYTLFEDDINASQKHAAAWEKKGAEFFTSGTIYKRKRSGISLINNIKKHEGKVFYYGIEKFKSPSRSNPTRLYTHILSKSMLQLGSFFNRISEDFIVILDEHQNRAHLLEAALKTMHGGDWQTLSHLIQPPFQVESHLYQTLQAADWIASIVGPLWAHRTRPTEFAAQEWAEKYFGARIEQASRYSSLRRARIPKTRSLKLSAS